MADLNKKLIDYGGLEHFRDLLLNDSGTTSGSTWSSSKLSTELANKANKADYTIGMTIPSQGNIPVLDLTPLNSATTDGVYSIVVKTNLLTGTEEFVGFGQIAVINVSETGMVLQSVKITYNLEATKTSEITRMSEDGVNWEGYNFTNAVIDDVQNPYASFPWSTYSASKIRELLDAKQGTLTAGANISISGGTISATDTTYSAGSGITISGTSVSIDSNLLSEINGKQDELVAGTNITISGTTISATYEVATTADIEALFS